MNSSPDNRQSQSDTVRPSERQAKPNARNIEAGAKVKEAEAKLMEVEASLAAQDVAPTPRRDAPNPVQPPPERREPPRAAPEPAPHPPSRQPQEQKGADPGAGDHDRHDEHARTTDKINAGGKRIASGVKEKIEEAKPSGPTVPFTEHLSENVAGPLCYLAGWVTGLVFLLVDRRPFVRFHAAQSVAVFATLSIVLLALSGFFLGAILPSMAGLFLGLRRLVELLWLVAAVVLMLKASAGQRPRVGVASQYADQAAGSRK